MADVDEDERKLIAASIIQHHWREFLQRKRAAQGASGAGGESPGGDSQGGEAGAGGLEGPDGEKREQSEEEVRENLLTRARTLISQRDNSIKQNLQLQRTLAQVFQEKQQSKQQQDQQNNQHGGGDGAAAAAAAGGASSEAAEAKYWDAVAKVRSDRLALDNALQQDALHLEMDRHDHEEVAQFLNDAEREYRDVVRDYAMELAELSLPLSVTRAGNTQVARQAKAKVMSAQSRRLDEFEAREDAEYARLHDARVAFIQTRNRCRTLERRIKLKDNLDDDVQMIDFEQLKIENTNLNEKIEERNEDLLKLKKKATTTIHILTHVKEKLEFVKGQNAALHREVNSQDRDLDQVRGALGDAKRERDFFSSENTRMKEKMPLIGANNLLLDFELRKKSIENLQLEVVSLTNEHHELMLWIRANHPSTVAATGNSASRGGSMAAAGGGARLGSVLAHAE